MFRAVHNRRCHYTRNLEKGGRRVGKLRAVERRCHSGAEVSTRECAAARCLTQTGDRGLSFVWYTRSHAEPG